MSILGGPSGLFFDATGRLTTCPDCCASTPPPGACFGCPGLAITYTAGNPVGNNTCSISYADILLTSTCIPQFGASRKVVGATNVSGSQLLRNVGGTAVCTFRNLTAQGVPIEALWGAALETYIGNTVCAGDPAVTTTKTQLGFEINAAVGSGIRAEITITFRRADGVILATDTIFSGTAPPSGNCSIVTINNSIIPPGVTGVVAGGGQVVLSFA